MKSSFVLYTDNHSSIELLTVEQKAMLLDLFFLYHKDVDIEITDPVLKMAFSFFERTFERDKIKYDKRVEANKNNGLKGGRPKNPDEPKKPTGLNENPNNPDEPKKADTVPVSDPVTDPVSVPEIEIKEKKKREVFKKPLLEEIKDYCETNAKDINPEAFLDYYDTNGWKVGKNQTPMKDWKAAVRTWQRREDDKKPKPPKQEELPTDCYMGISNYRNDEYDELAKYGKQPIDYFFWSKWSFDQLPYEKKRRVYLNTLEFLKTYDPTYELNYEIP